MDVHATGHVGSSSHICIRLTNVILFTAGQNRRKPTVLPRSVNIHRRMTVQCR